MYNAKPMSLPSVTIEGDGVVVLHFTGAVNLQTFVEGREAIQKEPGWSPSHAHVFDFTEVTDIDLSKQAIETLAAATPVFDKDAPQILVARSGSFEFAVARTFEALARARRNVHVAESLEEARALLAKLRG